MRLEGQFDAALNLLDEFYDGFKHLSFHCDDEQNKKIFLKVIYFLNYDLLQLI